MDLLKYEHVKLILKNVYILTGTLQISPNLSPVPTFLWL